MRQELVADLHVGHRLTGLVASVEEQREHVVLPGPRLLTPPCHLGVDRPVDLGGAAHEPSPRREPAQLDAQLRQRRGDRGVELEQAGEQEAHLVSLGPVLHSEHGAKDHVEGHRLHVRLERERLADRPPGDFLVGRPDHGLAMALDALAVERRQEELALAQVLRAVEHEQGVTAEHATEQAVDVAHVHVLGRALEDLLDRGRVGQEHDVRARTEANAEGVAVAPAAAGHESLGVEDPLQRLDEGGPPGAGRELA